MLIGCLQRSKSEGHVRGLASIGFFKNRYIIIIYKSMSSSSSEEIFLSSISPFSIVKSVSSSVDLSGIVSYKPGHFQHGFHQLSNHAQIGQT